MSVLVWFVLAWVSGILLGWNWESSTPYLSGGLLCLLLICSVLLLLPWADNRRLPWGFVLIITAGLLAGYTHVTVRFPIEQIPDGKEELYLGKVQQIKQWGSWKQISVHLSAKKHDSLWQDSELRVLLKMRVTKMTEQLSPGDELLFKARLERFACRDSLADFNERAYWYGYGIRFYDWLDSTAILQISYHPEQEFSIALSKARQRIFDRIEQLELSEEHQAILLAMLTGNKTGLTSESKKQFSRLGIMHLLAVSGLHAGLIYIIFSRIFQFFRIPAHSAWNRLLSSFLVWLYVMICGFPASAIRAAAMISLHGFAHIMHRAVSGVQIVFLVAFLHTLFQPEALFSIGFQLSYLAVLGILIFYPKIIKIIQVSPKFLTRIRDLAAISFSAQILTLPVSIYVFASFPVWFLLANILLMPIGLLIFYFGLTLLVLPGLGLRLIWLEQFLNLVMSFWMGFGEKIADLPGSLLTLSDYPWMFFLVYGGIVFFSRFGLNKMLLRPYPLLILFVIWSLHGFLNTFWNNI